MAEWVNPYDVGADAEAQGSPTWGDYGTTFKAGSEQIGAGLAALARSGAEGSELPARRGAAAGAKWIQDWLNDATEGDIQNLTPVARKRLEASVTSPEFWEHPVSAAGLKATQFSPGLIAGVVPGGLMSSSIGAAAATAVAGGAINAGTTVNELYKMTDKLPDEELQKQSDYYAGLRSMGMDERQAREQYNDKFRGMKPYVDFAMGAAAGLGGPAGQIARGLRGAPAVIGAAERGLLPRVAIGAAEGAGTMAAQSGVQDVNLQQAGIELGTQKQFDPARLAAAVAEGAGFGGITGGVAGAAFRGARGDAADAVQRAASQPPKGPASGQPIQPVESPTVGNPQSAPTRGSRDGAKQTETTGAATMAPTGDTVAPDQVAALKADQPTAPAPPPDVAAAAARVQQPLAPAAPVAPTAPAVAPRPPGPDVAAAAQRVAGVTPEVTRPAAPPVEPAVAPSVVPRPEPVRVPPDTGQNVPEAPDTLRAQQQQLVNGERAAQMFPVGTAELPLPDGMKRVKTPRGVFHYNPDQVTRGKIFALSKAGRENELLGLGPVSKPEAQAREAAGEPAVAVVERQPGGTEVRAAAGTEGTAPAQVAALETAKTPGNVVTVEQPAETLGRRVLQSQQAEPAAADLKANIKAAAAAEKKAAKVAKAAEEKKLGERVSHDTAAEKEKIASDRQHAAELFAKHVPADVEGGLLSKTRAVSKVARDAIMRRANVAIGEAKERGVDIPQRVHDSQSHEMGWLARAAALVRKGLTKRGADKDDYEAFQRYDHGMRTGAAEEVRAESKAEGHQAMNPARGVDVEKVGTGEMAQGGGGQRVEVLSDAARQAIMSPEEALAAREEAVGDERTTREAEKEVYEQGRERQQVVVKGGGYTAVEAPKKPVVVEKAGRGGAKGEEAKARLKAMGGKVRLLDEVPPKVTLRERIAEAARRVQQRASEAQKEAGNFRKGHVSVHGIDVTIENPRGSVRTGVDPETGKPWRARLPDHYGYIRRTEGADGDQVDAFVGPHPESHSAWVIDQHNLQSGEFDEHKVMLGYRTRADALAAYRRAFTDGRGAERIGDVTSMDVNELKRWLKGDTTEPAGGVRDHMLPADEYERLYGSPSEGELARNAYFPNGELVKPLKTMSAGEALEGLRFDRLNGAARFIGPHIRDRLMELIGKTPVHVVDEADMARGVGRNFEAGEQGPRGMYSGSGYGHDQILVRSDLLHSPEDLAHAVLHEGLHNAVGRELDSNATMRGHVEQMMREALEHNPDLADEYAFRDVHEFISEAMSNPELQDALARVPVSNELAEKLGLHRSLARTMWDAIVNTIRKLARLPDGTQSMLEAALRATEHLMEPRREFVQGRGEFAPVRPRDQVRYLESNSREWGRTIVDKLTEEANAGRLAQDKPWLLKLRTMDNLAQAADSYFGRENNPVRKIADQMERIRTGAVKYFDKASPVITRLYQLERKYKGDVWNRFTRLVHDETTAGVFADRPLADQEHLGKDRLDTAWAKAQHPELAREYAELKRIAPDLIEARVEALKYFSDTQDAMSLGLIKNRVLKVLGIEDDELAGRIHEGKTNETDRAKLGDAYEPITQAKVLSKLQGPYFPLMRRGSHIVRAKYVVEPPKGARKISDNTFEFTDRDKALDWARQQDTKTDVRSVWVDKDTGEPYVTDEGHEVKVSPKDANAEQRFRAVVNDDHLEMFDNAREAVKAAKVMEEKPDTFRNVSYEERKFEPGGRTADMYAGQMGTLMRTLEKREGFQDMTPSQQHELRRTLDEAGLQMLGSTRIQSRRLPRRGVKGYSTDLTRNTLDYAHSASAYLSKLEHQPALEAAMKQMEDALRTDDSKGKNFGRSVIRNEVVRRVTQGGPENKWYSPAFQRLMTLSFLDKLFSPAHSIINSLQPSMVTMPVLGARHGYGRTFAALSKAYSDIGALGIVKGGLKASLAKARHGAAAEGANFIDDIKGRVSGDEGRMIDDLVERGSLEAESGLEIAPLIKGKGRGDQALGYLEGIARQMPKAIETINRTVTALAAYRLERARGASHEEAVRYAQETVNNTQFLYSHTNAPPLFNHPLAKIVLQFRKFGQGMYQLLGQQIGKALRNEEPGARAEALKTLAGIMGTHVAMAGAVGLPTEPLKYLMMGAQAAGLTVNNMGDVENWERKRLAQVLGPQMAEIVHKGLPHMLGIDLSNRVGLDSLTAFGEPRSQNENDVKKWLFDTIAGAPPALVGDWVKGAHAAWNGDMLKAAELTVPVKGIADSLRAYRQATEGKKTARGIESSKPYSPYEAAVRAIGFSPSREVEEGAKRAAFYGDQTQQKNEQTALTTKWLTAKPADKAAAWRDIQAWNADRPKDARITMGDLTSAAKRRTTEVKQDTVGGIRATKRDRYIRDELNRTYAQ